MTKKIKALKRKAWNLCREIVLKRDNRQCQICASFNNLQVDHCFSRTIGRLHFEIENLTTLCRDCHSHKSFRRGGAMDKKVDALVRKREGLKWWDWALVQAWVPLPGFSTVGWLEEKISELEAKK